MKVNERWLIEAVRQASGASEAVAAVIAACNEHDDRNVAVSAHQIKEATRQSSVKSGRAALAASGYLETLGGVGAVRYRLKLPGGMSANWPGVGDGDRRQRWCWECRLVYELRHRSGDRDWEDLTPLEQGAWLSNYHEGCLEHADA